MKSGNLAYLDEHIEAARRTVEETTEQLYQLRKLAPPDHRCVAKLLELKDDIQLVQGLIDFAKTPSTETICSSTELAEQCREALTRANERVASLDLQNQEKSSTHSDCKIRVSTLQQEGKALICERDEALSERAVVKECVQNNVSAKVVDRRKTESQEMSLEDIAAQVKAAQATLDQANDAHTTASERLHLQDEDQCSRIVEIETKNNRLAQQIEVAKSVLEAKDKQRLAILALKKGLDDTVKEISERKDALREATAKLGREISTIKHPEIMTPASLSAQFTVEPVRAKLAAESKKAWNIGVSEIVRGMKMQRAFKIFQAACKIAHELAVIKRRHQEELAKMSKAMRSRRSSKQPNPDNEAYKNFFSKFTS